MASNPFIKIFQPEKCFSDFGIFFPLVYSLFLISLPDFRPSKIIFLLPIAGLALLNINKKITEKKLKSVSENIPAYKQTVITSNYIETPIFSFFDDSYQRDGVTLSIKESGKIDQEKVVRFYDSWFKENGWMKTVTDVSSGQHHYVNNNVSAHLWLRDLNSWTIEINRR